MMYSATPWQILEMQRACLENACRVLGSADVLKQRHDYGNCLSLSVVALEELGRMVLIDGLVRANEKDERDRPFITGKGLDEQKLDAVKMLPTLFTHLSACQNRSFSIHHVQELAALRRRIDHTVGEETSLSDLIRLKNAGIYVNIEGTSVKKPSSEISALLAQAVFNYAAFAAKCMDRCFEPVSYMKFVADRRATPGEQLQGGRGKLVAVLQRFAKRAV